MLVSTYVAVVTELTTRENVAKHHACLTAKSNMEASLDRQFSVTIANLEQLMSTYLCARKSVKSLT